MSTPATFGGMTIYKSMSEAIRDGYQVMDRYAGGYLIRKRVGNQWAMARCEPAVEVPDPEC